VTFAIAETSPSMTAFPLSTQAGGGSGIVGLINIVFEVEGISEGEATYPSLVLSVGLFWIESVIVSFSSVTLSNCSCVSNNFSSNSWKFIRNMLFSVFRLFSSYTCCWRVSLNFKYFT
jgi:hypothetical protein